MIRTLFNTFAMAKSRALILSILFTISIIPRAKSGFYVCDPKRFSDQGLDINQFAFCDKTLAYNVRAKDLVDRMNISEKIQQMGDKAKGVQRIGLPPYNWWSEALHGISDSGVGGIVKFDAEVPGATGFPTVILTAASFNESLWKTIGQVVSTEGRAMYNLNHAGITYWSPVINVARDPRWGRTVEVPGEDPYVIGRYGVNFVRGMQDIPGTEKTKDPNLRPIKVAACCKHLAAYDLEVQGGVTRFNFDAKVTEQDMIESFLSPFEMCVKEGDVASIMCSYNRVNGIPSCADPKLLKELLRGKWKLHGYIVADCDAVEEMAANHHFLNDTAEDIVAKALSAGLDLDCENFRTYHSYFQDHMENATKQGKILEDDIDRSLTNLYIVLMRLGYFDGNTPYETLGKNDICTPQSVELAADAGRQGIVLLKNANDTLPLNPTIVQNLAVIGPHANATRSMLGNYAGPPCKYTSPLAGLSAYAKNVNYSPGCQDVKCQNADQINAAIDAAKNADVTIILAGLDEGIETEDLDRTQLLLPGNQTQLINQVAQASKGPTILVIMCAGGVDISFANTNNDINAIIWAGYPGAEGGRAIADVVFGKYNPGGRLPVTWYPNDYVKKVPMTSMQFRPIPAQSYPGRTYKFYDGPVVYPFGYGLSYTKFRYSLPINAVKKGLSTNIKVGPHVLCQDLSYTGNNTQKPPCAAVETDDLGCHERFSFDVLVENIGGKDGSEVVMVYSKPPAGVDGAHLKKLIGFQRVFVPAGGKQRVVFNFNVCKDLGIVDYKGAQLLPFGSHTIVVGDGQITIPIQVNLVRH